MLVNAKTPKLQSGVIYDGIIVGNLLPNNTVSVRVAGIGSDIPCQTCTGILSALFGFRVSYLPPLKTKVKVLYADRNLSFIIGFTPSIVVDPNHQNRDTIGPDAPNYQSSQVFAARNSKQAPMAAGHKPPVDLAEGEFQMDNLLGVALKLLRGMSSLSAGDLAMVECHLQDQMVRIVSDTFKHYSAFGDYKITNDGGKLNAVWNGTSLDYEAWGLPRATDPKVKIDPVTKQVDMTSIDGIADDGRWRFSQYVGWLGNFINLFVTDPVNAVGKIAEGQFRSGKFRVHVNNDGALLIQSVADIVLEKVVRIPVPNPIRQENDPNGNRTNTALSNTNLLQTWNPSNADNLFEMVFQLREYARWLNNTYSLARFGQMNFDFEMPTEAQTPAPDLYAGELDKAAANTVGQQSVQNYRIAYSTIRIYRDGSYQQVDAYGNAITTSKMGTHVSTPFDLYLEAGGSINMVAGRDINLLAQQNVGITAVKQAVRVKAQTGIMMLSVAGHMIMEVMGSFVAAFAGTVNIGNKIELNKNGNVTAGGDISGLGSVVGTRIAASDGMADGEGPHYSHVYPGAPTPVPTIPTLQFTFQTSYGAGNLYQSLSQQAAALGEQPTSGSWSFSGNEVAGRGSPWPGLDANFSMTTSGASLQTPSAAKTFASQPQPMQSAPVTIKYQT